MIFDMDIDIEDRDIVSFTSGFVTGAITMVIIAITIDKMME